MMVNSISVSDEKNKWEWLGEASGKFSLGSVKRFLIANEDYSSNQVMNWCKWLPAKCNIFIRGLLLISFQLDQLCSGGTLW
ncbi:hypothetical protein HanIR_Chr08g0349601 [Helianthus annuus]|nr:hypothetical protein HanIR_Chr08g0349601 [Helianthus annuus]